MVLLQKALFIAACFALISGFFAVSVNGDDWNKATLITVNQPIEIPGRILPAGTYMFKLMDSLSNRQIVQIMSDDQAKLYQTILAIPDERTQPTDKASITFYETPRGSLNPVRSWYYAGERSGVQFVYPKQRADTLAKVTNENVPSSAGAVVTEQQQPSSAELAVTKEQSGPAVLEKPSAVQAPAPAAPAEIETAVTAEPKPEIEPESQIALSAEPQVRSVESPQTPAPAPEERQGTGATDTLPRTASPDALFLLAGLGSALAAYGMRRVRS